MVDSRRSRRDTSAVNHKPDDPPPLYFEDIEETFGLKPRAQESDADRLVVEGHEHSWVTSRIAVGSGMWSERDVAAIRAEGITHVLTAESLLASICTSARRLFIATALPMTTANRRMRIGFGLALDS